MKKRKFLSCLFVTIFVMAIMGVSAQAGALMPKTGWVAKSSTNNDSSCSIQAEFENGFVFKLIYGEDAYNSMQINFRQDVFQTGMNYPVQIGIGSRFQASMVGSAVNSNVLEFILNNSMDFARAIESSNVMTVIVGEASLDFSLKGYGEGRAYLEKCLKARNFSSLPRIKQQPQKQVISKISKPNNVVNTMKEVATPKVTPQRKISRPAADRELLQPVDFTTIFDDKDIQKQAHKQIKSKPAINSYKPIISDPSVASNNSSKNSFGHDVPLAIAVTEIVPNGYRYVFGDNIDAGILVSWEEGNDWRQLLRDAVSNVGYNVRITGKTISITGGEKSISPLVKPSSRPADVWVASKGDNLKDILAVWSGRAGVDFVWSTTKSYKLPNNVSYTGTFDEAVRQLLSQFESMSQSPVGIMHTGTVL